MFKFSLKLFMFKFFYLGLALLFLLFGCENSVSVEENQSVAVQYDYEGVGDQYYIVQDSIYDGDTFRVTRNNEQIKIRLCGIDAPEMDQPLGKESRDYLRSLLVQSNDGTVNLNIADKDRYGRTVAEVFVPISEDEEIAVNGEMLLAGMAYHYARYSGNCFNGHLYSSFEEMARKEKKGVWADSNNIPPWEHRRNKR
jgi:endonuclease YncB( thermonuclease family)